MIYLDHAAATPVSEKAKKAMLPYFSELFFNPSAAYLPAKHVKAIYEEAKSKIAHVIGAKNPDIVITSGATESIKLAFTAASKKCLVLETEHAAVLENAKQLDYDFIRVDRTGLIDLNDFQKKLTHEIELVSISLANNELGTIQPIAEISELIRREKYLRIKEGITTPLYLHSDASQALNLIDINVARLGVDLLTLNSAKVYGPKGVGALYVAHGVKLKPIAFGGGQENGLRSGTENVPLVVGFATALEEAKKHLTSNRKKYQNLSKIFCEELKTSTVEPIFLGNKNHSLTNFVSLSFPGLDAERLIYKLEEKEIYVSTGAACAASKGKKSHVLKAIGLSDSEIDGSIRISFGESNNEDQVRIAANEIKNIVKAEYDRTKK